MPGKNPLPLGCALSASDMDEPRDAGGSACLEVGKLVAGHDRVGEIEVEAIGRLADHPRRRLPPTAEGTFLGRMSAGEFGVEHDPLGREQIPQSRGDRLIVRPAVEAATDAGLVGDEDQRMTCVAKTAERRRDARNEH